MLEEPSSYPVKMINQMEQIIHMQLGFEDQ